MNQIFVPIERVHVETVFEAQGRVTYALLQPAGGVTPLRMRFADLRKQLSERFSHELPEETVVERIGRMQDEQLLVVIHLDREGSQRVELSIRRRYPFEQRPVNVSNQRKSPRRKPSGQTDVRLELGDGSIEGTVYNISEHGLGIALHTTQTQLDRLGPFKLDETVELASGDQRVKGRLRSQYPADGGCVLGVELEQRLRLAGLPDIEA
jgi:hypothetical protein